MSTPTEPPLMSSPEPSTPSSSTTPSTPTTTTSTSTTSSNSAYQIPNMNVYINKATCRDLNLIHHPHTETNIHPATLLARIHFNAEQLFYLRSHSAAYPIVTTLFALPQEDWFECRIYPYPNGIPPMMMPPPPITTPLISSSNTPTTPTLNLPPLPIPTPLVHSSSLHSLFMNSANSPIDTSHKKTSSQQHIHSPLPLINIHDQWYLRRAQSPGTSTTTTSSITSTPSSLSSSPSFQSFLQAPHHDNTLSTYPYPTTTPPTNINIQHINYQIPNQPTTTTTTATTTTSSRKRKNSSNNKKHNKDNKKRITTRSHTRKQEGEEEEEEEEESELSTPSDMEEDDSRPSSPDPLALPTTDAELFKRKKVLKKVYKKRYQQKKSIKRKIARFHATGDKAVVIFVTRNSQRKFGYDVEFYNPITSSNDFMNRFWKEQSSLVESYLQHHYVHKKENKENNLVIKHEEEDNSNGYIDHSNSYNYTTPTNKYTTIGSTDVGVPQQYLNHVETNS